MHYRSNLSKYLCFSKSLISKLASGFLLAWAFPAMATVHFTLESMLSQNNIPLSAQNNRSVSASVALDLGTFLRVGLTHRQSSNQTKGYIADDPTVENPAYSYRATNNVSFANSVDLTIILYYGQLFVPYLQLGMVKKDYLITVAEGNAASQTATFSLPPVPNGGIGVGIRLNRNFSLKLSYSVSPGVRQVAPNQEKEGVLDSFTSIGITYNL